MEKEKKSKIIIWIMVIAVLLIWFISFFAGIASATTINPGDCTNVTSTISFFNETTNLTDFTNSTQQICSASCNQTSFGLCTIKKTFNPGDIFSQLDSACDINFSCSNQNLSSYNKTIPIYIEADQQYIKVSVDGDVKAYPRLADSFSYKADRSIMCPSAGQDSSSLGTIPANLDICMNLLSNQSSFGNKNSDLNSQCNEARTNAESLAATTKKDLDNCNTAIGNLTSANNQQKDTISSQETFNVVLMIMFIVSFLLNLAWAVLKLYESRGSGLKS